MSSYFKDRFLHPAIVTSETYKWWMGWAGEVGCVCQTLLVLCFFLRFKKKLFIWLCQILVVACKLLVVACGI